MTPETEIRNLKRELQATREDFVREHAARLRLERKLAEALRETKEWRERFDVVLRKIPEPKDEP